jgi:hypothetical protein
MKPLHWDRFYDEANAHSIIALIEEKEEVILHAGNTNHSWDLRPSGILHSVEWYSFTDVSGQRIVPFGKGQENFLTIADGTDTLSRNVGKALPLYAT